MISYQMMVGIGDKLSVIFSPICWQLLTDCDCWCNTLSTFHMLSQ